MSESEESVTTKSINSIKIDSCIPNDDNNNKNQNNNKNIKNTIIIILNKSCKYKFAPFIITGKEPNELVNLSLVWDTCKRHLQEPRAHPVYLHSWI